MADTTPTDSQIADAARDITMDARLWLVRAKVEVRFGLPVESLKSRKTVINKAVDDALKAELQEDDESDIQSHQSDKRVKKEQGNASATKKRRVQEGKETDIPKKRLNKRLDTHPAALDAENDNEASTSNPLAAKSGDGGPCQSSEDNEPPPKVGNRKNMKEKKSRQKAKGDVVPTGKDEQALQKLKALVVACGVRKQWTKEFAGMDSTNQQAGHVRKILQGLGMSGRMSLEQAKTIRKKRELAEEIEDAIAFDAKVNGVESSKRASRSKAPQAGKVHQNDTDPNESAHSENDKPRNSVLAFLNDQSSDSD